MVKLGEVCEINMGKTPSRNIPDYWGGKHLWASISDLKGSYCISSTKERITDLAIKETGIKPVKKGTLLYSFKLSIGKVAITEKELFTNEAIVALPIIDESKVDTRYLYYAVQQINLDGIGDKAVKGITLNKEKLKELTFPLPPLATQQRIADILDKADALRRKDQALLQKYDELAQAVFVEMFGDPVRNEKGWEVKRLEDCTSRIQIGPFGTQLHESDYIQDGIPIINPMHMRDLKIYPNNKYSISKNKYQSLEQYWLKHNDIILARRGEMGRCALVTEAEQGYLCGTGSLVISTIPSILDSFFLTYLLSRNSIKSALENIASGTTMANLNRTIVSNFKIIVPPIAKQKSFNQAISVSENSIEILRKSLSHSTALFQSLLQKAFTGELVP